MENYEKLKELVEKMDADMVKFYEKDVKAAAPRLRSVLMEIKKLAQEMRVEIQEKKNSLM